MFVSKNEQHKDTYNKEYIPNFQHTLLVHIKLKFV